MKKYTIAFLFIIQSLFLHAADENPVVSIYDEFDDGLFGRSKHRGIVVSVKKAAFARSETLPVKEDGEYGFLTAVVISAETVEKLEAGYFGLSVKKINGFDIYTYNKDGLFFKFSVEKAKESLLAMVSAFYSNDNIWHDPLMQHYRDNYVIRIHSAENIIESWTEEITYNEALIVATLIGDDDQWLWGIHDGSDILNAGY